MPSNSPDTWNYTTLGECSQWYSGGTPSTSVAKYWNGDIPWITASSLHEFYITDSERKVTSLGIENGTRLMPKGTIIFVVRGMSLKSEFRVGIAQRPMAFGQDCKAIIAKESVDLLFLANVLRAKSPEILNLVDEASHGTGRLQTSALEQLEIPLPPMPEQRAIAHILGTLDDKIELNRQMNQTLEEMARVIFKSWFVDFDPVHAKARGDAPPGLDPAIAALFPDAFQETELGPVPVGWRVASILEFAKRLSGGTPKTSVPEYWDGDIKWVSAKDVRNAQRSFVVDTERMVTITGIENSSAKILPQNTTVVTARGTVGSYCMLAEEMSINQTNYGLKTKLSTGDYFVFFSLANLVEWLQRNSYGTIFDTITTKTFESSRTVFPTVTMIEAFEETVSPLMESMRSNLYQNRTLVELRDTLLPKLMSGELRVPEAEEMVEEVK